MTTSDFEAVGYRWIKPTWERTADRSWVLIIPSSMLKSSERGRTTDPQFDGRQRLYDVYNFDGSWLDQLHEQQVERLFNQPAWRNELRPSR